MKRTPHKHPVTMYQGSRIRHITERKCWQADFTALGKRDRKRFKTLSEAKTWIDQKKIEIANRGKAAFSMTSQDRLDIADARKWLGAVSLSDVFNFWKAHHPAGEQKTVEQLKDEFLKAPGRRGKKVIIRRAATIEGHRNRLLSFVATFGQYSANEITQTAIEEWLNINGWTGLNRRHYLASVRAMFAHAQRRGYVAFNAAENIELPDVNSEEPEIMTTDNISKYLQSVADNVPELLPREAISFFCGLRPEELTRLNWRNVSIENKLITVTGEVAKVQGHRRNVEIPANLIEWLLPYAKDSGKVWEYKSATTLHRKRVLARTASGIDVPNNAGRHAFASYHLAAFENSAKTAEAMGHSDIKLLRNVYRNIVSSDGKPITKNDGITFFNISPKRTEGLVQFRAIA